MSETTVLLESYRSGQWIQNIMKWGNKVSDNVTGVARRTGIVGSRRYRGPRRSPVPTTHPVERVTLRHHNGIITHNYYTNTAR